MRDGGLPLLRWPGGKRWLAPRVSELINGPYDRLIEPFAGGAAVFFSLQPGKSVLSDINPELITAYSCVRDSVEELISSLTSWSNDAATYYQVRALKPTTEILVAARLLYLAKLSFNGIYRVNLKGQFNVPYGHKTWQSSCDAEHLRYCSKLLESTTLMIGDFANALSLAGKGDVVYLDPPYTVAHNNNGFIKYNEVLFKWDDQIRLSILARQAMVRGALVIVSNADHVSVDELYPDFSKEAVRRYSSVAASGSKRSYVTEKVFIGDGR